jgi:hypothetical protein
MNATNSKEVYYKKFGNGIQWHPHSRKTHEPMKLVNNGTKKLFVPLIHEIKKEEEHHTELGHGLITPGSGMITPGSGVQRIVHTAPSKEKIKSIHDKMNLYLNKKR